MESQEEKLKCVITMAYRTALIQIIGDWSTFYRMFIDREGGMLLEKIKKPYECKFYLLDPSCVKKWDEVSDTMPFPRAEELLRAHIETLNIEWGLFWESID